MKRKQKKACQCNHYEEVKISPFINLTILSPIETRGHLLLRSGGRVVERYLQSLDERTTAVELDKVDSL